MPVPELFPTTNPVPTEEPPVYASPAPKLTVWLPATTTELLLTGGVFQVAALLHAPLLVATLWA
jgi:hypothetical protein